MDLIVKHKIETLLAMCEGIGSSDIGEKVSTESLQKAALFELGNYLMYLASADGGISYAEADFIGEAIPLFQGWMPSQFRDWILDNNIYSTDFEQTPPTLLPFLVTLDNIISQTNPDTDDYPELFLSIYRQVGQAFLACDGESDSETSDFNTYIRMMRDYIAENGTRERRSSYHTIDVGGHQVGVKISVGTPVVSYSDDEEEDDLASDDDFEIDDGCLTDYLGIDEDIVIPDGVTRIGDFAFFGKDIESVELPEGVTALGDSAFSACENLTEIHLPEGLVEIGDSAFMHCKHLMEIHIPGTVRHIGDDAFCFCNNIKRVSIPASLTDIGNDAFMYCSGLESVTIFGSRKNSAALTRLKKHFPEDIRFVWKEEESPQPARAPSFSADNVPTPPEKASMDLWEHLALTISKSYTSQRDADFVAQPIRMLMERCGREDEEAYELMEIPGDTYTLHEDALRLAEVFRLQEDLFDPYADTEAMIHRGMFENVLAFHALRALAWTVCCIAEDEDRSLESYSFEELQKIGKALEERHPANYEEDSYCPGLCGHYDWRVFYVPDNYLDSYCVDMVDLRGLCGKENRGGSMFSTFSGNPDDIARMELVRRLISRNEETLVSLQELREDLIALKPVMETLYDGFMEDRDRSEPLQGHLADALTAWCALSVAAREPFYSEEASDSPETEAGLGGPMSRPYSTNGASPAPKAPQAPAVPRGELLDLGGASVIEDGQFINDLNLRNIIIPEGVTRIGERAFNNCMNLETVVLPGSLRTIGKLAFMSCRALRQVEIPEGVEEICDHAFGATNSLKAVHLPDSLQRVDKFIFGMGGDSPYAVAHMSGALAHRLQAKSDRFTSAISARGFVIDGEGYSDLNDFVRKNTQAAPQPDSAAERTRQVQAAPQPGNAAERAPQAQAAPGTAHEQNRRQRRRITMEIQALTEEMNSLTGIFASMKRKKLQNQINELQEQLRRL